MAVVDALLASNVDQVGYLKTIASAAVPTLAPALAARIAPRTRALAGTPPRVDATDDSAAWRDALSALERAIARRLFAELGALRVFGGSGAPGGHAFDDGAARNSAAGQRSADDRALDAAPFDIDTALRTGRVAPAYRRWLAHALTLIARHGPLRGTAARAASPKRRRRRTRRAPNGRAHAPSSSAPRCSTPISRSSTRRSTRCPRSCKAACPPRRSCSRTAI